MFFEKGDEKTVLRVVENSAAVLNEAPAEFCSGATVKINKITSKEKSKMISAFRR